MPKINLTEIKKGAKTPKIDSCYSGSDQIMETKAAAIKLAADPAQSLILCEL
jgi:hypothetical protein